MEEEGIITYCGIPIEMADTFRGNMTLAPKEGESPTLQDKLDVLRNWLRFHGDYSVVIDLHGMYGLVWVTVTHLGKLLRDFHGETVEKRLDEVLAYLNTIDERKEKK